MRSDKKERINEKGSKTRLGNRKNAFGNRNFFDGEKYVTIDYISITGNKS